MDSAADAEPTPLRVLYADAQLAVVDKPEGLLAHESRLAARESDTLLARARDALGQPAWLAHRLDRATSGCVLLGLDRSLMAQLGADFMERRVEKRYLAVVRGWPDAEGLIDHPLDGGPGKPALRPAQTAFRRLATVELPVPVPPHASARYALIECRPHTGRYRQIRRHLKHIHHHLIGDTSHGDGRHNRVFRQMGVHRMLLHAWQIALPHPLHGQLRVLSPPSGQLAALLARFGWSDAVAAAEAAGAPAAPG